MAKTSCIVCQRRRTDHPSRFCDPCRSSTERFDVPSELGFDEDESFIAAPELATIGNGLLEGYPDFSGLLFENASIDYLWKQKGGEKNGNAIQGRMQRPTGELKFYSQRDFVLWVAADHCFDFTRYEITALVFHELLHGHYDDENTKLELRGHDFEGFVREVEVFGLWSPEMTRMAAAFDKARDL